MSARTEGEGERGGQPENEEGGSGRKSVRSKKGGNHKAGDRAAWGFWKNEKKKEGEKIWME